MSVRLATYKNDIVDEDYRENIKLIYYIVQNRVYVDEFSMRGTKEQLNKSFFVSCSSKIRDR